jgi:hypothetical protein
VESENTILLTGYSYYSKYWFNPSSEVARVLDKAVINGYRVVSRVLPVSFRVVVSELPRLLEEQKPRIALGLGLDRLSLDGHSLHFRVFSGSHLGTSTSPTLHGQSVRGHGWLLSPTARGSHLPSTRPGLEQCSHHLSGGYQ